MDESNLLQYLSPVLLYSVDASTEGDQNKKVNYILSPFEDINDSAEKKNILTSIFLSDLQTSQKCSKDFARSLVFLCNSSGMIKLIMSSHNEGLQSYRKNKTTSNL